MQLPPNRLAGSFVFLLVSFALAATVVALGAAPAVAQVPSMGQITPPGLGTGGVPGGGMIGSPPAQPFNRNPVVSPYLNLTQPGLDPAITYSTIIRPELQFRNAIVTQSQLIQDLERQSPGRPVMQSTRPSQIRHTGHAATFLSTGAYFPAVHPPGRR